jgi:hypothetical protein
MEGLAKSKVVDGINTGFGALSKVTISPGDLEELQINLCCVVEPLQQADYEKNEDRGRSYEKTMQNVREEGSTERAIHLYEMRSTTRPDTCRLRIAPCNSSSLSTTSASYSK